MHGAFTGHEMDQVLEWTGEVERLPEVSGKQWVFHEKSRIDPDSDLISRIEYISPFHAGFAELTMVTVRESNPANLFAKNSIPRQNWLSPPTEFLHTNTLTKFGD